MNCEHKRVKPDVYDQTLGVYCLDCNETLHVCWQTDHIPESLRNRACDEDSECVRSELSRNNVCAICRQAMALATTTSNYDIPDAAPPLEW